MTPHRPAQWPIRIGVGIDTARYGHHVTFLHENLQPAAAAIPVAETAEGYQRLRNAFDRLGQRHPGAEFCIRIDAAGPYAVNLEAFLRRLAVSATLSVGEPVQNRRYREIHFPKRKADPAESYSMARFALLERPTPTPETPVAIRQLREIASRLESQTRQCTRHVNQLHNLMARVFPELAILARDFSADWVLTLLDRYPTATKIARARTQSLEKIAYLTARKARRIQQRARTTVGTFHGPVAERLVVDLVGQLRRSLQAERQLRQCLVDVYLQLPPPSPIVTIPGIGDATAAVLTAKIVAIDRFDSPDRLVSYFGTFPEEHASGLDRHGQAKPGSRVRMSKQGNDLVRKYLWNAARSAVLCNPAARALYHRQLARGKKGSVALGHVMRKLLHLVFAIWKTGRPFDPQHHPWESQRPTQSEEATGHKEVSPPDRSVVTAASSPNVPATAQSVKPTAIETETQTDGRIDFAAVRHHVSIEQILAHLDHLHQLTGSGAQRRGPCPVHAPGSRRGRTFSVNLDKNSFRCFASGCGVQGNPLDLWAAVHGLPLRAAAVDLATTFGLANAIEKRNPYSPPAQAEPVGGLTS